MSKLQQIVAYYCLKYPYKDELSKARLTKLVYLADWFSALLDGAQLTRINWVFNHYGPYVDDVIDSVKSSPLFSVVSSRTIYGSQKYLISCNASFDEITLSKREREILDAVINKTQSLYFNDFVDYVYSTYPVKTNERYSEFDLVRLAKKYKEEQATVR